MGLMSFGFILSTYQLLRAVVLSINVNFFFFVTLEGIESLTSPNFNSIHHPLSLQAKPKGLC